MTTRMARYDPDMNEAELTFGNLQLMYNKNMCFPIRDYNFHLITACLSSIDKFHNWRWSAKGGIVTM